MVASPGCRTLSDELAGHYRETMLTHADDPSIGACVHCQRTRCEEWRWAYERLVVAGRLGDLPTAGDRGWETQRDPSG